MLNGLQGTVPILFWILGGDTHLYNADNWEGWDTSWKAIGSTETGDALVLDSDGYLCEVEHGTGAPPVAKRLSKDLEGIRDLVLRLQAEAAEDLEDLGLKQLKQRKKTIRELKKQAPKDWREVFDDELEDIKEAKDDLKFAETPDGKLMAIHEKFTEQVYPVLREGGRFQDVAIMRDQEEGKLMVVCKLRKGETEAEVREIISRFQAPVPVEFVEFRR